VIVAAVAAVVTAVLTPLVELLAWKVGWVYEPSERSVHTVATPDVGGIAMFGGFLAAMFTAWRMHAFGGLFPGGWRIEPVGVVTAAAAMFLVGFVDDLKESAPVAKVTGMVLAGSVLYWFGVQMVWLRLPFYDLVRVPWDWGPLLTVLWVLGMANATNLIDGLDGLAAGIMAIASGAFFLYSQHLIDNGILQAPSIGPLLAVIVFGMSVGFLPRNLHPAKIFMGDGGALLLGLLMASSTIVVGGRISEKTSGQSFFFLAPIFIPLVILGVPMLDTAISIVRRAVRRKGIATPDREHLHHRLMQLGHGPRRTVAILWCWTALLSGVVLYPALNDGNGDALVPAGIAALGLLLYTVLHPEVRLRRRQSNPP
jgi:UDP-GlcNAc:undecaprenyl-phosphate GlcNAc-1-phosphate transferase